MKRMNKIEAKAYDFIFSQIQSSRWSRGKQLKEQEISSKLKISRTPVRHALSRLIEEGIVYKVPNKGVFVGDVPLSLSQRKERIYFLEALLQHILYTLQLDETTVDTEPLFASLEELRGAAEADDDQFESFEIDFWNKLLSYHSNTYMNDRVVETMRSLYRDADHTPLIFKKSRTIKLSHYKNLLEWLDEKNYTYARREIRILLNQLLINLIQGVDD